MGQLGMSREALRLAHELILAMRDTDAEHWDTLEEAAAELRRLHEALAEPRPIQECYGDCPTNPKTCPNPCNFEGRPKPEQKGWFTVEELNDFATKLKEKAWKA